MCLQVVIGGWNNNKSCIRYGGQGDIVEEATTFNIVSGDELRRFWISWDRGLIQVKICFIVEIMTLFPADKGSIFLWIWR